MPKASRIGLTALACLSALTIALFSSCNLPASHTASSSSGTGSIKLSIPSVAPWATAAQAQVQSFGKAVGSRAYVSATSVKVQVQDASGKDVITSQTVSLSNGSATLSSVPVGSGYTVTVYLYNSSVSSSDPVVSGSATGVAVSADTPTSITVTCKPCKATALTLGSPAYYSLAASGEQWYSVSVASGTSLSFVATPDSSSGTTLVFLFDGDGNYINYGMPAVAYKPTAAATLYVAVWNLGSTASTGSMTASEASIAASAVSSVSPADMTASGATTVPGDFDSLIQALVQIGGTDALMQNLQSAFNTSTSAIATAMTAKQESLQADYTNALSSKSMSEDIDMSGQAICTGLVATTAKGKGSASAVTTDGLAIASNFSNLKSAAASATISLQLDTTNELPSTSAIKYGDFRLNAAAKGSLDYYATNAAANTIVYEYDGLFSGALSFVNASGVGGKLIITGEAMDMRTLTSSSSSSSSYIPTVTITATLYNDAGVKQFSKTWNNIMSLASDIQAAGGTLNLTIQ
jgi:hypothetical protein